ncbi:MULTISPECIES: GH92 family glycosyl hydrolase [unclassified Cellulophaga]|uniref:GH92 family glycosyl hydrolase n=1 Tax=unclassified Cellulophaga TaxID=2634405 RepID=UPI0026E2F1DA|nr:MULTISPECIES: GH92 family glycosyl hydrolase [unclassified Cellulophaga]MDO6492362.1 GH92 family glycosyl hydrolase [Cellulophaga sp. 2_MG-2023]MDO6496138.1 GH92 family glycosyl hydrolase [Cellulophaga sp. 3_MG-2023]
MKLTKILFPLIAIITTAVVAQSTTAVSYVDYVNPLVGSDSEFALSNGNTYPAIATPWGMNFWTPQTGKMGDGWGYTYDALKLRGFKQTHQPSPWINDYAAFSLFPETGKLKINEDDRASWYSHKSEISKPHYYSAYLADYDVTTEITPTERGAQFRFTFPESKKSHILVDGFFKGSMVKIIPEERKIIGYCRNNSGGVPDNFHNYFVLVFDKDFDEVLTWKKEKEGKEQTSFNKEAEGYHVGAAISFSTKDGEQVTAKVASSFISLEQAEINLKREIGEDTFSQTKEKAANAWNKELGRMEVDGGTVEQYRTFYTALYRVLLFPRKFYELNAADEIMHYSPYNGKVLPGYMFTDNGFWDTFRAVFPFFTIMYPDYLSNVMQGLVNTYNESGWLPEWASPGHRDCMIGSNSAINITDAYLRGIRGFDIETLYEAVVKNSTSKGPVNSVGRFGAEFYNDLGYVPYDVGVNENAARTLEYAYADWSIAELGEALGKPKKEVKLFRERSLNYKNVFDPKIGFMRGKNKDGSWATTYTPDKWGDAFTEGAAWHWTWCVFHDPLGLAEDFGGVAKMRSRLDDVFTAAPTFNDSYYGQQIHEITEMLVADMGQYAHGNQPIQHAIYLYNWLDQPWKTQMHVRNVMDKLYSSAPDGLCGDEDNGQTSAWYVFSAAGFYPVTPGTGEYALGSPLFKSVKMHLRNGNTFTVNAPNNSKENIYIDEVQKNGNSYKKNYITFDDIMSGSTYNFGMKNTPNKNRGMDKNAKPYSMSITKK